VGTDRGVGRGVTGRRTTAGKAGIGVTESGCDNTASCPWHGAAVWDIM